MQDKQETWRGCQPTSCKQACIHVILMHSFAHYIKWILEKKTKQDCLECEISFSLKGEEKNNEIAARTLRWPKKNQTKAKAASSGQKHKRRQVESLRLTEDEWLICVLKTNRRLQTTQCLSGRVCAGSRVLRAHVLLDIYISEHKTAKLKLHEPATVCVCVVFSCVLSLHAVIVS